MKISNILAAMIGLFLALVLDWTIMVPLYTWVSGAFTGDFLIFAQAGVGVLTIFITIGMPILLAVSDTNIKLGE